jgi:hypothetical protein
VTIYRRSGASGETFTKLGNPATLPTGVGRSVSFSLDGTYLTVVHDTTPFVTVYKISVGDVLTKLPNPTVLPAGNGRGVNWLTNTSFNIVHAGSPYVRQYYVNNADGSDVPNADDSVAEYASQYASLTAITQRGGVDDYSGAPGGLFAAPDSKTVMSTDSSPYIHAYISACSGKFCSPLVWNKLPNPSPLPSAGNGISISPDGLHIAIVTNTSPYISIYKFPDGLIDYPADPECGSWWDNTEGASEATIACSDSVDNDADGFIDFQSDPGCTAASDATE